MKALFLISSLFFISVYLRAQTKPEIVYKTIKPNFWNNLKIAYSLNHRQRFKDRLIIKDNIDSSKLRYDIKLNETDPLIKCEKIISLKELNDSQVLIRGNFFVKKTDYTMVEIAKIDPKQYTFRKKKLCRDSAYFPIRCFHLYTDSSGKVFTKYTLAQNNYLLNKRYINNCKVTNLNIWVNSKSDFKKTRRRHFIKTFAFTASTLFLLEATVIGVLGIFFAVE